MHQKEMTVRGPQISQFNNIAAQKIPRSQFIRDFTRRTTFNADYLVPMFVDEILPGDDVNLRMTAVTRMATPIKPLMDNLYLETFWFFVPYRLVWDNWEKFQGQQTNPGDSTAYTIPALNHLAAPLSTTGFTTESLYDYLGMPILVTGIQNISALYSRAYNLIWNEWFRDENLQSQVQVDRGDGPDTPSVYQLLKRNKRKDYFTSTLPWPQKGDAASIPLVGNGPVVSNGNDIQLKLGAGGGIDRQWVAQSASPWFSYTGPATPGIQNVKFGTETGLEVDFSDLSAVTINALRQTALYQQILELDARGGTRYVESIYSRFGVVSPDFRLQRPELIGQGSTRINVYAVPQTGPTTDDSPQGNLAAFGVSQIQGDHGCRYSATEHGLILGLLNVRADLTYQQGLPRMYSRRTRLDFYEPLLNGLGEQAVLQKEIYASGAPVSDDLVFGYQERFAEYRFKNSEITGKFRSQAPLTMDIWHAAQFFSTPPSLNSAFITENVPMDRILAVTDESDFLADIAFSYNHVRPMPIRSNPGITKL